MELEKFFEGGEIVSMKFREIIDKEELTIDSKRLAEFNERNILISNINDLAEKFIDDNVSADDYETTTLIYRFAEKIKTIIGE